MRWKVKAAIQNGISALPPGVSYAAHYRLQRLFGGLRQTNPIQRLTAGIQTWNRIVRQGVDPSKKMFFEVGTGTAPIVPLAFWLMGAKHTLTVDINPYLREELLYEAVEFIAANRGRIAGLFDRLLQHDRLNALLQMHSRGTFSLDRFLNLCNIEY